MSAISLTLLLAAGAAAGFGGAALLAVRGLRREVTGLRTELAATAVAVPEPRRAPVMEDVRSAVADALADERERELAEARAFWAAQEAREVDLLDAPASASPPEYFAPADDGCEGQGDVRNPRDYEVSAIDAALLDALLKEAREADPFLPCQTDRDAADAAAPVEPGPESPEMAAARRRHPSDPRFSLSGEPVEDLGAAADPAGHERTVRRLAELAGAGTVLTDVRPGPLGTLDVYVFADGTTVCMSPGHRETADRLAEALRDGENPVLLGGSGVSGAFALTFSCGEESLYVLADRLIASL